MADFKHLNLDRQAQDNTLTTDIIADEAVTGPKLAPGAITLDKLDPTSLGQGLTINHITDALDVVGVTKFRDIFTLPNSSTHNLSLSFTPLTKTESVLWNGLALNPGISNDYIVSTSVIILSNFLPISTGDVVDVSYAYYQG